MNPLASLIILADGWGDIAFPLIVLIFAILGSLFKKKAEQGQKDVEQKRRTGREDEDEDGWIRVDPERNDPARMGEQGEQRHLRQPPPVIENRYRNTRTRQTPPPRRRQQQQGAEQPPARQTRRQPPPPPKRQPGGPHTPTTAKRSSDSDIGIRVNLTKPQTAKAAIIFSEILSPPKALREGPERWDM